MKAKGRDLTSNMADRYAYPPPLHSERKSREWCILGGFEKFASNKIWNKSEN
jgi:hypothetical protein